MDSILKIVLISPFQNKTGLSGNTSMFQITVRVTTLVTCSHERAPGTPGSHVPWLWSFPQQNGQSMTLRSLFPFPRGVQGPGCSQPRTILSTWQPLGLERSRYLHLFAFAGRVQVILHQDFPTQKDGLCQTERDFLSCPCQGSCMPRPAPSSRHLAFSRYSKEQILPQTQFLLVGVIFFWQ